MSLIEFTDFHIDLIETAAETAREVLGPTLKRRR